MKIDEPKLDFSHKTNNTYEWHPLVPFLTILYYELLNLKLKMYPTDIKMSKSSSLLTHEIIRQQKQRDNIRPRHTGNDQIETSKLINKHPNPILGSDQNQNQKIFDKLFEGTLKNHRTDKIKGRRNIPSPNKMRANRIEEESDSDNNKLIVEATIIAHRRLRFEPSEFNNHNINTLINNNNNNLIMKNNYGSEQQSRLLQDINNTTSSSNNILLSVGPVHLTLMYVIVIGAGIVLLICLFMLLFIYFGWCPTFKKKRRGGVETMTVVPTTAVFPDPVRESFGGEIKDVKWLFDRLMIERLSLSSPARRATVDLPAAKEIKFSRISLYAERFYELMVATPEEARLIRAQAAARQAEREAQRRLAREQAALDAALAESATESGTQTADGSTTATAAVSVGNGTVAESSIDMGANVAAIDDDVSNIIRRFNVRNDTVGPSGSSSSGATTTSSSINREAATATTASISASSRATSPPTGRVTAVSSNISPRSGSPNRFQNGVTNVIGREQAAGALRAPGSGGGVVLQQRNLFQQQATQAKTGPNAATSNSSSGGSASNSSNSEDSPRRAAARKLAQRKRDDPAMSGIVSSNTPSNTSSPLMQRVPSSNTIGNINNTQAPTLAPGTSTTTTNNSIQ